ncbi:hypothetical protein MRX96_001672 [Rhipicephalus microplus]
MDSNNKIKIWHWNANGFQVPKSNPTTILEITGTDGSPGRDSGPRNLHRRHADAARVSDTRLPPVRSHAGWVRRRACARSS